MLIKHMFLVTVFLVAIACMFAGASPPTTKPANETKPLVELWGAKSKIEKPAYLRITSLSEFRDVYMRHLGEDPSRYDEYYNPHGVPTIDFDKCMVIAIFQGASWNSAGVRVISIDEDENRILVRFDDRSYQTANSSDGGAQRASAYGIFILPRSEKAVVLEEDVCQYLGSPPVWKEVVRFQSIVQK